MLEKLTGKLEIKEELKELKSQVEDILSRQKESNESLRKDLAAINNSITSLENNKNSIISSLKKDLEEMQSAKEELSQSVKSMQEMQSTLYSQVYGRLDNALKEHVNSLKSTTDEFESLKPDVKNTMLLLSSIREDINRLKELSKTIKLQDLQLSEHMNNVQRLDDEKLRLMRQIDKLQDIIAKHRRGDVRRLTY